MVVDESHRLHERIDRRRTHERPSAPLQIFAERLRFSRDAKRHQRVFRDAARTRRRRRFKLPDVRGERAVFLHERFGTTRVVDRGFDLSTMTDDAGVVQQATDFARAEARHARNVESGECLPECFSFPQDREPTEARLKSFETDFFEQPVVVNDRTPPFLVVVAKIERIAAGPPAS